jgi:hypothetical protein
MLEDPDAALTAWLMELLEVPGKPAQLKRLSAAEKLSAVEHQVEHLRKTRTSLWYRVEPAEIVAATIFRGFRGGTSRTPKVFGAVKTESALKKPVAAWLRQAKKADVYGEIPMGTKRVDVMGHRKEGMIFSSDVIVAVELKNEIEQLKRGLDQMTTFGTYAHEVYLACTRYMAAEYLSRHADAKNVHHWDPDVLNDKLRQLGFGLLLVDGDDVDEIIPPVRRSPDAKKVKEVLAVVDDRKISL